MSKTKETDSHSRDSIDTLEFLNSAVNRIRNNEESDQDVKIATELFSECFYESIFKILEYVEEYKETEDLEVEFRLGFITDSAFDTDIPEEFYQTMFNVLDGAKFWNKKNNETSQDFFSKGKRKSVNLITKKETIIKKEKLCTLDFTFHGTPFDVRVSFSREIPKNKFSTKKIDFERQKKRKNFVFQDWNYDLTTVTFEENTLETKTNEVEIELNKPLNILLEKHKDFELIHSSLLKIRDLIYMCEKPTTEPKLIFKREKKYD
jgi:hypothetical protein